MSVENVKLFLERINKDAALQDRFSNIPEDDNAVENGLKIAHEEGFDFSAEEFFEVTTQEGDLSDSELGGVSGGAFGDDWGKPKEDMVSPTKFTL